MCRRTWTFHYKLFILHHSLFIAEFIRHIFGAPEGTRTPGLLLRSSTLHFSRSTFQYSTIPLDPINKDFSAIWFPFSSLAVLLDFMPYFWVRLARRKTKKAGAQYDIVCRTLIHTTTKSTQSQAGDFIFWGSRLFLFGGRSMPEYQLELKQLVNYPRCRMYRQFIRTLMDDRSIRVSGGEISCPLYSKIKPAVKNNFRRWFYFFQFYLKKTERFYTLLGVSAKGERR